MAKSNVAAIRPQSTPNKHAPAAVAYREMTRLWQAKEIIQLAAHASPECVNAGEPPMKQALECAAQMIQVSIEALCSMEEDLKSRGRKSDAAEVVYG